MSIDMPAARRRRRGTRQRRKLEPLETMPVASCDRTPAPPRGRTLQPGGTVRIAKACTRPRPTRTRRWQRIEIGDRRRLPARFHALFASPGDPGLTAGLAPAGSAAG
ncbi:hypothetical protein [Stappia indica]|uniref:Uncharacterized protein n=1 Tax=Stappia indica TaxID=538381 RepID=A0A857C860_9HYPH|nr:hypothetical protein [Stappia indica]QGZ35174.1 hypothetical protein GH266_12055 [Stappia indica]